MQSRPYFTESLRPEVEMVIRFGKSAIEVVPLLPPYRENGLSYRSLGIAAIISVPATMLFSNCASADEGDSYG
jgi:hypothetical protein